MEAEAEALLAQAEAEADAEAEALAAHDPEPDPEPPLRTFLEWAAYADPASGEEYYHNVLTGESLWEAPHAQLLPPHKQALRSVALLMYNPYAAQRPHPLSVHRGWALYMDPESLNLYYCHLASSETSWEPPEGWDAEEAEAPPLARLTPEAALLWSEERELNGVGDKTARGGMAGTETPREAAEQGAHRPPLDPAMAEQLFELTKPLDAPGKGGWLVYRDTERLVQYFVSEDSGEAVWAVPAELAGIVVVDEGLGLNTAEAEAEAEAEAGAAVGAAGLESEHGASAAGWTAGATLGADAAGDLSGADDRAVALVRGWLVMQATATGRWYYMRTEGAAGQEGEEADEPGTAQWDVPRAVAAAAADEWLAIDEEDAVVQPAGASDAAGDDEDTASAGDEAASADIGDVHDALSSDSEEGDDAPSSDGGEGDDALSSDGGEGDDAQSPDGEEGASEEDEEMKASTGGVHDAGSADEDLHDEDQGGSPRDQATPGSGRGGVAWAAM
ncbi:hypothetical protein FNF31_05528 [Cafeteria roenbergensis]|uniref:WW domain-containing protein n=1 Tax=Cafeteria roenbergensis TaxID=33653 RepID=A0A5A8D0I9_CAFRO|nr:hypothetical protein FNF31_05528 [Cafeteria roenbergensis]